MKVFVFRAEDRQEEQAVLAWRQEASATHFGFAFCSEQWLGRSCVCMNCKDQAGLGSQDGELWERPQGCVVEEYSWELMDLTAGQVLAVWLQASVLTVLCCSFYAAKWEQSITTIPLLRRVTRINRHSAWNGVWHG